MNPIRYPSVFLFAVIALGSLPGLQAEELPVAFLAPLEGDLTPQERTRIEAAVAEGLSPSYRIRSRRDIAAQPRLAAYETGPCDDACGLEILRQLPAQVFIRARLERLEGSVQLGLEFFRPSAETLVPVDQLRPIWIALPDTASENIRLRLAQALNGVQPERQSDALTEAPVAEDVAITPRPTGEPGVRILESTGDGDRLIARLRTIPPDSEVIVRQVREGGRRFFRVTVRHEGYREAQLAIEPGRGEGHTIEVTLEAGQGSADASTTVAVGADQGLHYSALWRSAILPGWGQYYKGSDVRGGVFMTLFFAAFFHYKWADSEYQRSLLDYRLEYRTLNTGNALLIGGQTGSTFALLTIFLSNDEQFMEQTARESCTYGNCERVKYTRQYRDYSLYLLGIVYVWNLVDALIVDAPLPATADLLENRSDQDVVFSLQSQPDIEDGARYEFAAHWRF
ncbi:MAG: hypothetical protein H7A21_14405 [Spirochaetales bacterium]|nr:hypothetical protein [Leptospiraceae bacterium]MCP5482624.1 hypothetical protein [Spirochaetales bacterium]MCP5485005.1 hypothetical protein [Spirochaetales bacterium]